MNLEILCINHKYTDINDIPLYMVLNYETGEAVKMPEETRAAFETPVTAFI